MLCLHHAMLTQTQCTQTYKKIMLCLVGRPDSWKMEVTHTHTPKKQRAHTHRHAKIYLKPHQYFAQRLWRKKAVNIMLDCEWMVRSATINPLSSCYVILKFSPKVFPYILSVGSLAIWTGKAFWVRPTADLIFCLCVPLKNNGHPLSRIHQSHAKNPRENSLEG